jgi:hypothetical protein
MMAESKTKKVAEDENPNLVTLVNDDGRIVKVDPCMVDAYKTNGYKEPKK